MKEKSKVGEMKIEKKTGDIDEAMLKISLRGRKFEGYVIKKFDKRVVIEFGRVKLIRKYERYLKTKTKIHARIPESLKNEINLGDYIQVMECRPLSKIIHHVVVKKIRNADIKSNIGEIK